MRLDWLLEPVRETVALEEIQSTPVFHYSIPFLDEFADGAWQDGSEIESAKQRVHGGEILISRLNPRKSRVHITSARDGLSVCSGEFVVLRPRAGASPEFLRYLLASDAVRSSLDSQARSVTRSQQRVGIAAITKMWLDLPAEDVQRQTVNFLDAETARIDALSAELVAAASLSEERLSAAQINLVTGRSAASSLRATGVEWLGPLPDHWSIVPLKSVARMESGHTPSRSRPELWEDCSIPWISLNDVGSMGRHEFITSTTNLISDAGIAESSARLLPAETVVLSRDATIGRASIMAVPMATSQHFVAWVCGEQLRPRYLWLLFSTVMQSHFDTLTEGSTIRTIGMPELRSFKVPLPSLAEQDAIIEAAAQLRERSGRLQSELATQLSYLREHRQALVTAAVTGGPDAVRRIH
jgi:type I restriction enzyme S subunit